MTAGNGNEGEVNWGAGERETAIEDQAGGQSRTVQQSIRVPALEEHGVTTSNSRLHLFRKFARRSEYRGEYALGGEIRHLPEPPFRPRGCFGPDNCSAYSLQAKRLPNITQIMAEAPIDLDTAGELWARPSVVSQSGPLLPPRPKTRASKLWKHSEWTPPFGSDWTRQLKSICFMCSLPLRDCSQVSKGSSGLMNHLKKCKGISSD